MVVLLRGANLLSRVVKTPQIEFTGAGLNSRHNTPVPGERALPRGHWWRTQKIPNFRTWLLGGILLGPLFFFAACAAGRIVGETYRDPENGFQVRLPPAGWIPRALDGATLSFESPDLRAALALLVECHAPETGDLPGVARHLFFGLEGKRFEAREAIRLHDAPGVRTRLRARLEDAPVEVEGVTFRRARCLYDFIYVAPPAAFPQGHPDFDAFVQSWAPLSER